MEARSRWWPSLPTWLGRTCGSAGRAMARAANQKALGQGLVEYSLIIALIVVVVIAALTAFGGKVSQSYSSITARLP